MRVGIVTQSYLPIHGGVAQHVHHTAEELRKRGHEVEVVTAFFNCGDENFSDGVTRIGHDVTIPMNGAFVNVTIGTRLAHQLRQIEDDRRFDIVHIHSPFDPILPLIALRTIRAPKVGTFHTYREPNTFLDMYARLIRRHASKLAARIAVSESAQKLFQHYFPGEYTIIPNGVDTDSFRPDLEPVPELREHPTVLFVGRMDPRKGLKYLLQAFPAVARACPEARLVVVGGGILAGYYKGFIRDEVRDKIRFEGYVSAEQLPRYYASASVYCSPATANESFGIVLIEAMAAGTPVVAYANPGYERLMRDGKGGILVENKNVPALADALIRLLGDDRERQRLSQEGREKSLRYAWPRVTEDIEAVYSRVLQRKA